MCFFSRRYKIATVSVLWTVLCVPGCASRKSGAEHVRDGRSLYDAAKYEEAALVFRKAIQKEATLADAYYWLGMSEMHQQRFREAYDALSKAIEMQPNHEQGQVALADLCLGAYASDPEHPAALYERVKSISEQLLKRDPKSYDGLRLSGYIASLDGRVPAALSAFRQADAVRPLQPEVWLMLLQTLVRAGQEAESEAEARAVLPKIASNAGIYEFLHARYMRTGRQKEAEELALDRAGRQPKDAAAVLFPCRHYANVRRAAEVSSCVDRFVSSGNFTDARLKAGEFYESVGNWQAAIGQYEAGARESQQKLAYQHKLLRALDRAGDPGKAGAVAAEILRDHPGDRQGRLARARLAVDSGSDPDGTLKELQALAGEKKEDADVEWQIARLLRRKGDYTNARQHLLNVTMSRPNDVPARMELLQLSVAARQFDEGLRYADQLLSTGHNGPAVHLLRSAALLGRGEYAQAQQVLQRVVQSNPSSEAYLQLGIAMAEQGKTAEAHKYLQNARELAGKDDIRATIALAEAYLRDGNPRKAVDLVTAESDSTAGADNVQFQLARISAKAGQYDAAISQLRSLIAKNPKHQGWRMTLGETYYLKGDFENARQTFQEVLNTNPDQPQVLSALASSLNALGRTDEARDQYQKVLSKNPNDPVAANNLAFMLAEQGRDLAQATTLAERAVQRVPQNSRFIDTLGWVYLKRSMTDEAIPLYQRLLKGDPGNPLYHYRMAVALYQKGRHEQARTELQASITKGLAQPESGAATTLLAKLNK